VDLSGAALVRLLDQAAAVWLPEIDLYDVINRGSRDTVASIMRRQAEQGLD
jgi:hypothetical protein